MFFFNRKKGYSVKSYGTGSVVKLPGPAPEQPNVFPFGTTYEHMYQELYRKDPQLYPFHASCHHNMITVVHVSLGGHRFC